MGGEGMPHFLRYMSPDVHPFRLGRVHERSQRDAAELVGGGLAPVFSAIFLRFRRSFTCAIWPSETKYGVAIKSSPAERTSRRRSGKEGGGEGIALMRLLSWGGEVLLLNLHVKDGR